MPGHRHAGERACFVWYLISGQGSDCICCDMKREAAHQLRKLPELFCRSSVRTDQSAYFQCLLPPPQIPAMNYYKPPSQLRWLQLRLSSERAQQDSPRMPPGDFMVVNKVTFSSTCPQKCKQEAVYDSMLCWALLFGFLVIQYHKSQTHCGMFSFIVPLCRQ